MVYKNNYNAEKLVSVRKIRSLVKNKKFLKASTGFLIAIISLILIKLNHILVNRYLYIRDIKLKYCSYLKVPFIGERVIEIPLGVYFVSKCTNPSVDTVLEVGNVLSHYYDYEHVTVDKYEHEKNVMNIDIVDYNPNIKYSRILSISTIEHIGFDEEIKEYGKAQKAITKLLGLLKEDGKLLITVPIGVNPEIDEIVKTNKYGFQEYFMKRISWFNTWVETTTEDAFNYKYGKKYPAANSLAILLYTKEVVKSP